MYKERDSNESTYRLVVSLVSLSRYSSLDMASYFALRVDGDQHQPFSQWFDGLGSSYLIVRETVDGENVHMHMVFTAEIPIKSIRSRFNRAFPDLVGNKAYSLTTVQDLDKYHRYLCKGADEDSLPEILARQGVIYTNDWVHDRHGEYWDINAQLQVERDKRKRPVFDEVLDEAISKSVKWTDDVQLSKMYIRQLSQRAKGINLFAVRSQVNLLKIRLCPDDSALDALAEAVAYKQ